MARLVYTSNLVDSLRFSGAAHQRKFEANGAKILKLLFHGSSVNQGTPYGEAQVGFPERVRNPASNRHGAQTQNGAQPVCDFISFFGNQFLVTDAGRNIRTNSLFSWEFTHTKLNPAGIQGYFATKISNYLEIIKSEQLPNTNRNKFHSIDAIRAAAGWQQQLRNGGNQAEVVYDEMVAPHNFSQPDNNFDLEWNLFFVISSNMSTDLVQQMNAFVTHFQNNPIPNWTATPINHIIPGQGPVNYPGAIEFEDDQNALPKLRVGFIPSNSFIDLAAEIEEICDANGGIEDGMKRRQFLSRCIGVMSGDAFSKQNARFLYDMHSDISDLSQANNDFTSVKDQGQVTFSNGATATKYSITGFSQRKLIQLCMVPRTLRNPEALQRPPNWKHLKGMSESIVAGKSFALPIIAITDGSTSVDDRPAVQQILPVGPQHMIPNNWEIVDGQHRAYSYFALPQNVPNRLDLQLLVFDANVAIQDRREAAAELFFDINHRSLEPDKVHAIAHYSKFDDFETGWRFRNGEQNVSGDKATWSSRLLAGKFILELNQTNNSPFLGLFDVHGIDSSKIPLSSVTQYLSCFFEFGRKWTRRQNIWQSTLKGQYSIYRKYQNNPGGNQLFPTENTWKTMTQGNHLYRGPSPKSNDLQYFWPNLIQQFHQFLTLTGLNNNQIRDIFNSTSQKSARLPAIFSLFAWYTSSIPQNVANPANFGNLSLDPAVNAQVGALSHLGPALLDPQTWTDLPTGRAAVATIAGKLYNRYCEDSTNAGVAFRRFGPSPNGILGPNGVPPGNDDYKSVKWVIPPK